MKRYLAFAVLLCLLFTSVPVIPGYAVDVDPDIAVDIGVLNALGIVTIEETNADLNQLVTRAEFVAKALKMLKIEAIEAGRREPLFTDVPENHYYHDILVQAAVMGVIGGNDNGTFEPDNPITLGQACKVMLYTLGYNQLLEASGNSLTDCYKAANRLKILLGISVTNLDMAISLRDAYQMIFNALHTKMCAVEYMTADGAYRYKEGETVLKNVYNTEYTDGVVEADYYYSLSRHTADEDTVVIDGVVYTNVTEVGLVGYKVRCYYYAQGGSARTALYVYKLRNKVIELKSSDVLSFNGLLLQTLTEQGSKKQYTVSETASVLYNGKLLERTDKIEGKLKEKATRITMIDNNEDNRVDIVLVNHYKNIFVSRIDRLNQVIYGSSAVSSNEKIDMDYYEKPLLISADGDQLSLDNVTENCVVSICIEADDAGSILTKDDTLLIYVSSHSTTDTVKANKADTVITIDDVEISISDSAVKEFSGIPFHTPINIYFDVFGDAVYFSDGETNLKTGYLIDIAKGTFGSVKVKMFDKARGVSEYEIRNRVKTRLKDGTLDDYKETEFYRYVTDNSLTHVPVLFDQNSNNEIAEVWFLSDDQKVKFHKIRDDIFEDITASEYYSLFIYKSASRGFMSKLMFRDASSEVLVVPKKGTFGTEEGEGFYQVTTPSYFTNGARFNCSAAGPYKATPISMKEDGFMTDILVWEVDGSVALGAYSKTNYGIVTDILETWNAEKGEKQVTLEITSYLGTALSLAYDGKLSEKNGPYDSVNKLEIEAGDWIAYGLDPRGYVSDKTAVVCYDASEKQVLSTMPFSTSYRWDTVRTSMGEILQRDGDFILLKAMRGLTGTETSIECHNITSVSVYTYDEAKRTLRKESVDKMEVGDKFFLSMNNGIIGMAVYYE